MNQQRKRLGVIAAFIALFTAGLVTSCNPEELLHIGEHGVHVKHDFDEHNKTATPTLSCQPTPDPVLHTQCFPSGGG
jgi:hypothetical protein